MAVDAGHGGTDAGTYHRSAGLMEKDINLDVARALSRRLTGAGARVVLTRADDSDVELEERVDLADREKAHLFVSIHVNEFPVSDCFGGQTFYYHSSPESRRLALLIQEELVRLQPENFREALPQDFLVLRGPKMPSVLVEVGFLSNPGDRRMLADPAYRDRIAESIFLGILRYVRGEGQAPIPP